MVSSKAAHLAHHLVVKMVAYLVAPKVASLDSNWADSKETLMASKKAYSKADHLAALKVSHLVVSKDEK